ncbi:hypothetical protein GGR50DRAFT_77656 [Xylaria sp. CBS 124048]|nr:hypothetical protein GGR50DRAFT_77656 [Xylaria sp. CBS 124048]
MATKKLAVFAMSGMLSVTEAFWRMECRGSTGTARIDPIVDFGMISSHSHVVHGSSGFSMTSKYDDLRNGDCTSCAVKQDKSAYWTPNVYFRDDATGDFTPVNQVGGMLAYYLVRGENVSAFPPGFQMVAGNNLRRDYTVGSPFVPDPPQSNWAALNQVNQVDLSQRAIGFNCLNYAATPEPSLFRHYLPNKTYTDANCLDGVRFELMFPSCWNGELDSPDHQSHVAYPSLVGDGDCPDTHPLRLVTLFFETIWDMHNTNFLGKSGSFVIANGDETGFGYHGDFMSGWDQSFLQSAVDTCTNESGELGDCGVFTSNGPLLTQAEQGQCKFNMPSVLANENVLDVLKELPGGLPIQNGPQSATLPGSAPTVQANSKPSPTPHAVPSRDTHADDAAVASVAVGGNAAPIVSSPPAITPAPQGVPASEPSFQVVSTQYTTIGDVVEEVVWVQPVVYVTKDTVSTVTVPASAPKKVRGHNHHRHVVAGQ